ncbi:MAG: hypothetical protein O2840_00420 [bacterium]|nr:hypothetical protein [bacterium]
MIRDQFQLLGDINSKSSDLARRKKLIISSTLFLLSLFVFFFLLLLRQSTLSKNLLKPELVVVPEEIIVEEPSRTVFPSDEVIGWKKYSGSNFSFVYPATWLLDDGSQASDYETAIEIVDVQIPGKGILQVGYVNQSEGELTQETLGERSPIVLSGLDGVKIERFGEEVSAIPEDYMVVLVVLKESEGRSYSIFFSGPQAELSDQVFDQILASFSHGESEPFQAQKSTGTTTVITRNSNSWDGVNPGLQTYEVTFSYADDLVVGAQAEDDYGHSGLVLTLQDGATLFVMPSYDGGATAYFDEFPTMTRLYNSNLFYDLYRISTKAYEGTHYYSSKLRTGNIGCYHMQPRPIACSGSPMGLEFNNSDLLFNASCKSNAPQAAFHCDTVMESLQVEVKDLGYVALDL